MAAVFLLSVAHLLAIVQSQPYNQPLDQFIASNDDHYHWDYTGKIEHGTGWTAHLVNMTSQQWLNSSFVNRPIWWHWLWIVIPTTLNPMALDYATVVGTGGHNDEYDIDSAPKRDDIFFLSCQNIARDTGSICAVIYQIPNEPLIFHDDPLQKSRSEDAIIAFGWHQFSKYQGDEFRYQWITHFPMVKATIRAMDTVAEVASELEGLYGVKRFGVSGASKRGWSAWLTAAADRRVEVMVPIVMDMVNFIPNLHHQYKAYGGWTWAFEDYYDENITQDLDAPYFADIIHAADPYSFFDRFNERKLAKFIVDGTWDEFFMPDDERFWWNELDDPKYLLMNPDADHSQAFAVETDIPSLTTFIGSYLNEVTLPKLNWVIGNSETGNITLRFNKGEFSRILEVVLWHGRSCGRKRRDFRMLTLDKPCLCGIAENGKCLNLQSTFTQYKVLQPFLHNETFAVYVANPPDVPDKWWEAFMIGIKYKAFGDVGGDDEHKKDDVTVSGNKKESWFKVKYGEIVWTTQVSIIPQEYPFHDCSGERCKGYLV